MPPVTTYPDVELMVVQYLAAALGDDAYVCTVVPDDTTTESAPIVRVHRVGGGISIRQQLDYARLDVDLWHIDLQDLNDLTNRVRWILEDMRGHLADGLGAVTQTREEVGPRRLPETDPTLIRTGFTVGMFVRPDRRATT